MLVWTWSVCLKRIESSGGGREREVVNVTVAVSWVFKQRVKGGKQAEFEL